MTLSLFCYLVADFVSSDVYAFGRRMIELGLENQVVVSLFYHSMLSYGLQ